MSKESASIIQSKVFPLVDSTSYYISSFFKAIHSENQGLLVQSIRADLFSDHCVCRECLRGIPSPTYTEEERKNEMMFSVDIGGFPKFSLGKNLLTQF